MADYKNNKNEVLKKDRANNENLSPDDFENTEAERSANTTRNPGLSNTNKS